MVTRRALLLAVVLAMALPASAQATVYGNSLQGETTGETCPTVTGCAATQETLDQISAGGVITSWRVKTDNQQPEQARLELLAGSAFGAQHGETVTIPAGPRTSEFDARISVAAGTAFGLDGGGSVLTEEPGIGTQTWLSGGEIAEGSETRQEVGLLLNVTVEPDENGDGYGDETQSCPGGAERYEGEGPCLRHCPSPGGGPCIPQEGFGFGIEICPKHKIWEHADGEWRCVKVHHHPRKHHRKHRHRSHPSSGQGDTRNS